MADLIALTTKPHRPNRDRYAGIRRQIARNNGLHPIRDRAAIEALIPALESYLRRRHGRSRSHLRPTMKVYTDARIFDLSGAVEKLPINLSRPSEAKAAQATGTDGEAADAGRSKSVSSPSAEKGDFPAVIGGIGASGTPTLTLAIAGDRQQKTRPARTGRKSGRWDSNPRRQPWEGCILPLNYARKRARES